MSGQDEAAMDPEAGEDLGRSNPAPRHPIGRVIAERLSRRGALRGLAAVAAAMATEGMAQGIGHAPHSSGNTPQGGPSSLTFPELRHQMAQGDAVAEGYRIQPLLRWGDPILADAPEFDPLRQSPQGQAGQFGYNNDYLGFLPLPRGSRASDHGLLVVNHEFTNPGLMFPGLGVGSAARRRTSEAQARIEMMAHGASVVEVRRGAAGWAVVRDSPLNRRLTAESECRIAGPAAGHPLLRTGADPSGTRVRGMLNNCAGGTTPWGTVLTCEENINTYFGGEAAESGPQAARYRRMGIRKDAPNTWLRFDPRFDVGQEPNEPNRFGWVVEFDPHDPQSLPVKRTALGRFKHEGCTQALCPDGRVAFYMGDDERNEYVWKFVTARPWNAEDPAANRDLLDEGTLHAARFEADGTMRWLPLLHGEGSLTAEHGFHSQADVVIEARRAADLLGATPMDRPEDVEANPATGRVYVILTNNSGRTPQQVDAANPRPRNLHGHVLEIIPPGAGTAQVDHAAAQCRWGLFLVAGKPGMDAGAQYHRATSAEGWLSCPDNCAFDAKGRIWITTDGADEAAGIADGLYAADTTGFGRALTRLFYQAPLGAEVCGPCFTPDNTTLFLAIQHPGEVAGSSFDSPATRWPDFRDGMPPRPAVIAITRDGGGGIG